MLQERRHAALSDVERKCSEELSREMSRMQKSLREARERRVERLRDEKEREAEAAEAEARLRSELELAREIAALRAECAADVERAGVVLAEREEGEARPMLEAAFERMTRRVRERAAEAEATSTRGREELLQALRAEWKEMLATRRPFETAMKRASDAALLGGHHEAGTHSTREMVCPRCAELEKKLADVQSEDASLRGAVADLRRRLEDLKASSAAGIVAPRVPPRKNQARVDAQVQTTDAVGMDTAVRACCLMSAPRCPLLLSRVDICTCIVHSCFTLKSLFAASMDFFLYLA